MSGSIYSAEQVKHVDADIVALRDGQGREVRVGPDAGFNAYSFTIPHQGDSWNVFLPLDDPDLLQRGGFSFGCPILFPFPNRTRDGRYTFAGRDYQLDVNWKDGNAIHGLVADRPWQDVEMGADDQRGAFVTARFSTADDPDVLRQYPFPCVLTVTYALREGALHLDAHVENMGDSELPMGFSIHPWFPAPLTPRGVRAECLLTLPARARWELESEEQLIPTGRILPLDDYYDFSRGAKLKDKFLDDVYTDLIYDGDDHVCIVRDEGSELSLEVKSSRVFREYVVYAPLDRDVICLEPYTATTDFVNLSARGVEAGLIVLAPGDTWKGTISITPRQLRL